MQSLRVNEIAVSVRDAGTFSVIEAPISAINALSALLFRLMLHARAHTYFTPLLAEATGCDLY
jgi:hypothetical protein